MFCVLEFGYINCVRDWNACAVYFSEVNKKNIKHAYILIKFISNKYNQILIWTSTHIIEDK